MPRILNRAFFVTVSVAAMMAMEGNSLGLAVYRRDQQTPASSATLFVGARLVPDGDRPPIENSAFLVQNDRIVRIGTRNDIQAPAGAVRVDLSGKTVIPAIVNAHGHVGFQKDTSFDKSTYSRESIVNQL